MSRQTGKSHCWLHVRLDDEVCMKTFKIQYSIIVYGDKQALHMEYGCQHYSSETVLGGTQQ